jgi:hypothetical protein
MHMRARVIISVGLLFLLFCPAGHLAVAKYLTHAKPLDSRAINNAEGGPFLASKKIISASAIKAEILLARAYFFPGEISGRADENLAKATAAFAEAQGKQTTAKCPPMTQSGDCTLREPYKHH